jgi:hypothetical protein
MAECVDELGKHLEVSESRLRFERETSRRGFWAATCMFIDMIAVQLSKFSNLFTKPSPVLRSFRQFLNVLENENSVNYWVAIEKKKQSGFHGPLKSLISLNIPTISGLLIKSFVIVNRYIDQLIQWRCLSNILHCTYTLRGKYRSIQYCSSLLYYRRLLCDVVSCRTPEDEI